MQRILFLCSLNRWRSPTAEQIFAEYPGIECVSAGLNHGADNPLTPELVEWADLIFVMERQHKTKLSTEFSPWLRDKRVVCLNIPDNYRFMDPALIKLLQAKVGSFLPQNSSSIPESRLKT
ncbi:low molecular weight protein tyrosine phosphatase family protein [Paucibacter sp. PLA-PC-4]|uniref:low molecular weight protein tyrosine phosphatase family protein n=1 Tax=Paucibacter sp. PLA-PC-4 TaxID=2993655 RepID=UPI0022498410|nr:low molecular weight protein tyrosine phosphatase family protein [Paucibacter sp. PLA-PC-4]MCX2862319.1 low molecular weight protein tyrosine phosphatase family protein [Paucibacter sp. PLA-PC-4]